MKDKIINLYHKILEVLKNCFDKLWGDDLPDIDALFPPALYKVSEMHTLYEKEQRKLYIRRFFSSVLFVVILLAVLNISLNVIQYVVYKISNNKFVLCWNKPVCVYRGAKLAYTVYEVNQVEKLEDGKFLFSSFSPYRKYSWFSAKDYDNYANYTSFSKMEPNEIIHEPSFQVYDVKKNKFQKLNIPIENFSKEEKENFQKEFYYNKKNKNILFIGSSYFYTKEYLDKPFYIYNWEDKSFTTGEVIVPKNKRFSCPDKYNDDKLLCISENTDYLTYEELNSGKYSREFIYKYHSRDRFDITEKEMLYTFDLSTFRIEYFADFDVNPKYYPAFKYKIFLKNGKFIIPIFKDKYNKPRQWDHIEIYDPITRKMYAEFNTDIFEKNILKVEDKNGDLIFLNKNNSYILKNNSTKFEQSSDYKLNEYNQEIVNKILNLAKKQFNVSKKSNFAEYIDTLPLSDGKFLMVYSDEQRRKSVKEISTFIEFPNKKLYRTIYIDYHNNIVSIGPDLPLKLKDMTSKTITQIGDNKYLIVGGQRKMCEIGQIEFRDTDDLLCCPTEYSYIIEIKE